jgi:hypothetical protein
LAKKISLERGRSRIENRGNWYSFASKKQGGFGARVAMRMGPKMAIFGTFPYMLDRRVVHTFPCTNFSLARV